MINESSLKKIMSNSQRLGNPEMAELARAILELNADSGAGTINTVTELGLEKNLDFNLNVIEAGVSGPYIIRLPYPPVKGRSSTVINNTGYTVRVLPSIEGGSINGTIDAMAEVPSDGKPYTFYCWENPLPGAWTWSPPATNQYDSGEITAVSTGTSMVLTAANASNVGYATSIYSTIGGVDGLNLPQVYTYAPATGMTQVIFKPSPSWSAITKFKVYTNQTTLGAGITARIFTQGWFNYYEKSTMNYYDVKQGQGNSLFLADPTMVAVAGSAVTTPVSANIGDPGTYYGESTSALVVPVPNVNYEGTTWSTAKPTFFGDIYCGDETILGTVYERWYTQYVCVAVIPRLTTGTQFKYRFFLEYN
jgi:hypothetical protein